MIKEQDIETIETWKIFILTHSILFSTPTLWTHTAHAKSSTHTTHTKILWTHATHTKFEPKPPMLFSWPMPKFYRPMPPMPKFDPHHPRIHAPMPPMLFSRLTLKWARVGCMKRGGYCWKRPHLHCFWLKK